MRCQRGAGLLEVSIALLLVSMAALGQARGQSMAKAQAEQARRHALAVAATGSQLELQRAHSPLLTFEPLAELPNHVHCQRLTPAGLQLSVAWPVRLELAAGVRTCEDALPNGWQQLALHTVLGEGW